MVGKQLGLACGVLAAVLVLSGAGVSYAEPKGEGDQMLGGPKAEAGEGRGGFERRRGPGGPGGPIVGEIRSTLAKLDLTEDQKEKVKTIFKETGESQRQWMDDNKAKVEELRQQARAAREAQDREKAQSIHQEIRKLMQSSPGAPEKLVSKIKGALTAEQATKLQAALDEAKEKAKERQQRRMEERKDGQGDQPRERKRDRDRDGDKKLDL